MVLTHSNWDVNTILPIQVWVKEMYDLFTMVMPPNQTSPYYGTPNRTLVLIFWYQKIIFWYQKLICDIRKSFSDIRKSFSDIRKSLSDIRKCVNFWYQKLISDIRKSFSDIRKQVRFLYKKFMYFLISKIRFSDIRNYFLISENYFLISEIPIFWFQKIISDLEVKRKSRVFLFVCLFVFVCFVFVVLQWW